jgi:hypothetical protein
MAKNKGHRQVMIKVNAECDEGIAPLVLALNDIQGVVTLDSCQQGLLGEAYVFFAYGRTWKDLAQLLQTLSSELSRMPLDYGYTLRIEWFGSNERPRAQIVVLTEHVAALAANIRALSESINARMCQSTGGKLGKGLRN